LIRLAAAAALLAFAAPAGADPLDVESMYSPETVVAIDLELPPESVAALAADPTGDYVEAEFSYAETDGTPAGLGAFSEPIVVGVRLKGTASFRPLGEKAAFKVKFNEFVKGQKLLGELKKLTLNNMVQDPSMAHEALAYETFAAAGVPGPRSGYVQLTVNGENYGLYANVETLDDVALEARFGELDDPQHLYEGEFPADVLPGKLDEFEVDEGDEDDRSDLEALIAALAAEGDFETRMAPVADLDEMTRMWAVERYIDHWDSYSGRLQPNNYYLYSDPSGVFQMLPSGTDQTWGNPDRSFGSAGGALVVACLEDAACAARRRGALADLAALLPGLGLEGELDRIAALLAPWQALEEPGRRPYSAAQIEAGVEATRAFIAARPAKLAAWLAGEPEAEVPAPPPAEPVANPGATAPPAGPTLARRLGVDRSRLGRGLLLTGVAVPGAGTLEQRGWIRTANGRIHACSVRRTVAAAHTTRLGCRLAAPVRSRLSRRWLRVHLRTRFIPADGAAPTSTARTVRLAREAR
jgi:hypothetical protein